MSNANHGMPNGMSNSISEEIMRLDKIRTICDDYYESYEWMWAIERQIGLIHMDIESRPNDLSSRLRIVSDYIVANGFNKKESE